MKLTDAAIRKAKPGDKPMRMADGGGLYLLLRPDGARWWRFDYRRPVTGARNTLSFGTYPDIGLADARSRHAAARKLLATDIDPGEQRKADNAAAVERAANTFGNAVDAWLAFRSRAWDSKTAKQARSYVEKDMRPKFGNRPIDAITAPELGKLVAGIEARGAFDVAKKTRQWLKAIFSFARANGWTQNDPARDLAVIAAVGPAKQNFAHLTPDELPGFLRALDAYTGSQLVKACAMLALWTANRPGVTRTLRWAELDLDAALWTIERHRPGMKRGYYHVTPLPTQAVALLRDLHKLTGTFEHVFIGRNDPTLPMSDGAVNRMLHLMGYKGRQTTHGFRHLVSTALNEQGYEPDWVERQLAHGDPDKIRATYNKAMYLEPRRKMMQAWADHIDAIRTGANVVPIKRKSA
ncbi:MAG: integrase arm-type DNA-binding domain-containing protein [Proteobacteria bacterium]|nr:integrase arm-type DNA-binding domain-containing protein [Pseudomonadota bacterium]